MRLLGYVWLPAFALIAGCTSAPEVEEYTCTTPGDADAQADVTITAQETDFAPVEGGHFIAWTYDGDVPGPVLRLNLGETRRVKLVNQSPRPTSLHFHGVTYANADEGSPDQPDSMVNPGCAHVYTITANQPGVWPYHSHADARTEIARGLYSAVIVPEKDEKPADHEFVVFLGQLGLETEGGGEDAGEGEAGEGGEGGEGSGEMEGMDEEGEVSTASFYMTINGRPDGGAEVIELEGDKYVAREGEAEVQVGDLVRWRVLNMAPDDLHTFHVHGHTWCDRGGVEEADGVCPAQGQPIDNVELAPAQGVTAEYVEDNPGEWMYHCHIIDHVNDGMFAMYMANP